MTTQEKTEILQFMIGGLCNIGWGFCSVYKHITDELLVDSELRDDIINEIILNNKESSNLKSALNHKHEPSKKKDLQNCYWFSFKYDTKDDRVEILEKLIAKYSSGELK